MDFSILINDSGLPEMSFEKSGDIFNNVYLSLNIIKGTWWFNPAWGMPDTRRMKNTAQNARLIAVWIKDALQWMIDVGRAVSIEVETERDAINSPDRLKAIVTVKQPNEISVTFTHFVKVV